jgi:hypothetical protein
MPMRQVTDGGGANGKGQGQLGFGVGRTDVDCYVLLGQAGLNGRPVSRLTGTVYLARGPCVAHGHANP